MKMRESKSTRTRTMKEVESKIKGPYDSCLRSQKGFCFAGMIGSSLSAPRTRKVRALRRDVRVLVDSEVRRGLVLGKVRHPHHKEACCS